VWQFRSPSKLWTGPTAIQKYTTTTKKVGVGRTYSIKTRYTASDSTIFTVLYDDDDESEVYYAQFMCLVASEGADALRKERRRRKDIATVLYCVGQPRIEVIAQ
jgi:hypothetical protein